MSVRMVIDDTYIVEVKLVDIIKATADRNELVDLIRELWRDCPVDASDCMRCKHSLQGKDKCELHLRMVKLGVVDE